MEKLDALSLTCRPVDLSNKRKFSDPFPHFHLEDAVHPDAETMVLDWLENEAPWSLMQTEFYEQHEVSLLAENLPEQVSFLTSATTIAYLKDHFTQAFGVSFDERANTTAHRLTSTQVIKIHNDYLPGQETHRLLIQLNRFWETTQGGLLILFSQPRPDAATKFVIPKSRSAFGFEISAKSLHAVSTVHSGNRFTIVYSFYAQP
jgi:Rps23 Pro-64 3,4-dihydroxylase Tpa1-like proline 4-hydroxylase